VLTLSTSGEGANSLLLRLHLSTHQSLLHCTLSPAIHFNGSNGTAYTGPSKVQNKKELSTLHSLTSWNPPRGNVLERVGIIYIFCKFTQECQKTWIHSARVTKESPKLAENVMMNTFTSQELQY
jgi:hypothetical protein